MKKGFLIIMITLVIPYCLYAQAYTLKGKIVYKDTPVSDVLILVETPHETFNAISDEKGLFKLNHEFAINDSIYISAHKEGYTSITRVKIDPNQSSIDLQFTELIYSLPEVVVATNKNVIKKANKTIYKNNSNLFLKKAKADVALRELPNISFANGDFRINNRKSVMLFIDGVEASVEEIKRLDVKDIDRFEVISNPSASYGSELHGGVINIIKKEKMEHYIKSEIEAGKGVRLDAFNVSPSVSYKNKSLIVNTFYSYTTNNQDNHSELERINDGLKTEQSIDKNVKGWQDYFSGRMNLILSKKSNISLTGNLFRYKFNSDSRGSLTENNKLQDIQYNTIEKLKNLNINGIYRYQMNNKSQLLMKGRFFDYKTKEGFENTDSTSITISTIREYSSEMVYEKKQITVLEAPTNYSIGSKYIHRKYAFGLDNFDFSQNVYSFYLNLDTEINSKLSLFASFYYDYTHNRNYDINKNYGNVLPSLSLLYKLKNSSNLTFDYSRKITRPSAEYLNPNPVIIGSLQILKGNPDLLPQITDNMEVTFSKSFNNDNSMTINIYNNIYQRLIDQIYTTSNGDVINSYANIGNAHVSGVSTGLTTKIFHLISLNFNAGVDYNSFSSSSNLAIVHKNNGYSFNGNANAYVLLKNDLSINLNCNYRSRNYSLVQTRRTMPLLILDVEKNLFKERMTVKLDYFDMFGFFSKSKGYINSKLFSQSMTNNDRMTNLTLSVVFRLGKNFSDHFKNPVINNDDIHTK